MKNKKTILASVLMMTLVAVSLVSAFGVSSPYWDTNPLVMARGEVRTVNLNLQNMVGDEDVTVKAELVAGDDITSLGQDTFVVEAGTSNTMVPLKIKMPKDASPGESKTVQVEFKTVQDDTGGIAMGTGMTVFFDVVAGEATVNNTTMIISIIIAIIVLALILWIILKNKKKK